MVHIHATFTFKGFYCGIEACEPTNFITSGYALQYWNGLNIPWAIRLWIGAFQGATRIADVGPAHVHISNSAQYRRSVSTTNISIEPKMAVCPCRHMFASLAWAISLSVSETWPNRSKMCRERRRVWTHGRCVGGLNRAVCVTLRSQRLDPSYSAEGSNPIGLFRKCCVHWNLFRGPVPPAQILKIQRDSTLKMIGFWQLPRHCGGNSKNNPHKFFIVMESHSVAINLSVTWWNIGDSIKFLMPTKTWRVYIWADECEYILIIFDYILSVSLKENTLYPTETWLK
jgi:hypothetical protein